MRGSLAIGAMAAMRFAAVSAEIMPIAVLTPLALDLKISEGFAGQAITMTALFAGIAAPMITILIGQVDRKRVLLLLSLSAIVANLLAVVASGLVVLLLARVLLGVALGGFFGLAAAAVVRILSMRRLGVGMSLVFLGMSGATVLAPPLGTLIESVFGWRSVFLCTGAIAGVGLMLQLAFLPRIPAREANDIGRVFVLLKRSAIVIGLLVSMVFMGGHIAGFAFIRPRLEASGFDTGEIAVCLLGYGVSNVIGMALGGFMADKSLRSGLCVAAAGMGGGTMVLWTGIGGFATIVFILAVWGAAVGLAPASLQTWVGKGGAGGYGGRGCAASSKSPVRNRTGFGSRRHLL